MSASSSVENQHQNPISRLNQYKTGLSYQFVGEYGPSHSKTFTVELIVDDQVGAIMCFVSIFCAFFPLAQLAELFILAGQMMAQILTTAQRLVILLTQS